MERFGLPGALGVTTLIIATPLLLSMPALAQHRPVAPSSAMVGASPAALGAHPSRRTVVMPTPRPKPPREPGVGRPLPGTFAGGVFPFYGRVAESVVLRPADQMIQLDVTINAVPSVAGIRAAPVGEPVFIRIGAERMRRQARHTARQTIHEDDPGQHGRHHPGHGRRQVRP